MPTNAVEPTLARHLATWLGAWPPTSAFQVVGAVRREQPGWDGWIHPAMGVGTPDSALLSVPSNRVHAVRALLSRSADRDAFLADLPAAIGRPGSEWFRVVFRWTTRPADLPDAGTWIPADDPESPEWLHPFGGDVLVARDPDTGEHLAGVGIKRHDGYGHELAVVTAAAARGRGLARRLVAQAARRVLSEGAVPTYLHATTNHASARVADAAGLPDRGWTAFGVSKVPVAAL
jgi:GNAT superfamily N-acetyltransferase